MIRPGKLTREQQLRSQRYWLKFNLLNGFSYMCLGDTVIILFAVKIDMPNVLVAVLGSMVYVGYLLLPLGKWVTSRIGAAQSQASFWVLRNFAALLVAAAAPLVWFGHTAAAMAMVILGAFFFYGFRGAGCIMGTPLIGEITNESDRAKVLGNNTAAFQVSSFVALVMLSWVLRLSSSIWMLFGVILIGSAFGFTSSRLFAKIDESPVIRDSARRPLRPEFLHLWRNSHYRSYLRMMFALSVSGIMIGPMGMLTLKRGCGVSDTEALLYTLLQCAASSAMSPFAARLVNRCGTRRVVIIGYLVMISQCLYWIFMPVPYCWQLAMLPFFFNGFRAVASGNAAAQYFLRAVPSRHLVAASILGALVHGAGAGIVGMLLASGTMKLAQALTASSEPYTLYRVYFLLVLAVTLAAGLPMVYRLKRFVGGRG